MAVPIITSVQRQKRASRRVSVFLDGAFAFGVPEDVAYRFGLRPGMPLDDALRERIESAASVVEAKRRIERLLARRLRSVREVRDALRKAGCESSTAALAIEDFARAGLLDDAVFARAFVADRMRLRPKSRATLRHELLSRGVDAAVADAALAETLPADADRETASRLAAAYLRAQERHAPAVRARRTWAYLRRRGYTPTVCREAMRAIGLDAEADLPDGE
jgi:regulatory protein